MRLRSTISGALALFGLLAAMHTASAPAAFPGQNGLIVFERGGDIWVVGADGAFERRLTDHPAYDGEPMFSPDGRQIVFETDRDGNREVYVMGSDGSAPRNVTQNPGWDGDPALSRDGTRIAFVSDREKSTSTFHGDRDLFVANLSGGAATRITDHGILTATLDPAWSPLADRLAFDHAFEFGVIVAIDADGTDRATLTDSADMGDMDFSPSWSPDGLRLVYQENRGDLGGGAGSIRVVDADGTDDAAILSEGAPTTDPAWSPDGARIVLVRPVAGGRDIHVMQADGTGVQLLRAGSGDEANLDWGPRAAPAATIAPVIWGEPRAGKTLAARPGSWSGTAPFSPSYQWLRCPVGGTTQVFEVPPSGDGYARASGSTYPPGVATVADFAPTSFAGRSVAAGQHNVDTVFLRFDTSGLPDTGTIASARIELTIVTRGSADGRNLVGDYYAGPLDASLHQDNLAGAIAVEPIGVVDLPVSGLVGLPLANLGSIQRTGTTTFRLQVSGGAPTGANFVGIAMAEDAALIAPRLVVTMAPSTTSGCTPIAGATSATYVPQADDVRSAVRVEVTATNGAGGATQVSPATRAIASSDVTAPNTTITGGPPALVASASVQVSFTSSEASSTFDCRVDAAAFSPCNSPQAFGGLADGPHTIEVRATDQDDNQDATPATVSFTVDTTPADTSVTSGPPPLTNVPQATLTFTSPEPGVTFECSLDGAVFASCTSPLVVDPVADGDHTFRVRAVDTAGNRDPSPASRAWTVDSTLPETSLTSGPPALVNAATATFTFVSGDPGATFQCRIDDGPYAACTSPHTTAPLADGPHAFDVRAVGTTGPDPDPPRHVWTIDTTPPDTQLFTLPPASTSEASAIFGFAATEAGATYRCSLDAAAAAACASPATVGPLPAGSHAFAVTAIDPAGNADPTPASWAWTIVAPFQPPPAGGSEVDTDGDGVVDGADRCPRKRPTYDPNRNGCDGPYRAIGATVQLAYSPRSREIVIGTLAARGVTGGPTRVEFRCTPDCGREVVKPAKAARVMVSGKLEGRLAKPGAAIVVSLSAPNAVGLDVRYTVVRTGTGLGVRRLERCLPANRAASPVSCRSKRLFGS